MKRLKVEQVSVLLFAVLILALAALACGGEVSPTKVGEVAKPTAPSEEEVVEPTATGEPEGEEAVPTDTPSPPALTTYQVGDIISMGDMVMVVLGWDSPPGDTFTQPDEGKKFVAVDVLFVNQGSSASSVSSMLQMSLKDDTGQKYDIDLMASVATDSSAPDGELGAGERVRGKVSFQVPEDASGLVFAFDADVFGTGKVFIELGSEPVAIEPPAELVGEQEQVTFAVGDVIEIGQMTLTVNEVTYPTGDDFTKPEPGYKFLVVDLTLENKGAEAAAVSSMLQMTLKDATGQKYDLDMMACVASGGTTPDGEISPGEKLRGQVGFQVPDGAEGLLFVFDADVFGYGKVFVQLP